MNWHVVSIRYGVRVVNHIALWSRLQKAGAFRYVALPGPHRSITAAQAVCDSSERADRVVVFNQDGQQALLAV